MGTAEANRAYVRRLLLARYPELARILERDNPAPQCTSLRACQGLRRRKEMTPTHVVADTFYGFIYTRDKDGHLLSAESAAELAATLNGLMPEGMRDYAAYALTRVVSPQDTPPWGPYRHYPVPRDYPGMECNDRVNLDNALYE